MGRSVLFKSFAAVAAIAVSSSTFAWTFSGYKWNPGPNNAGWYGGANPPGTPGSATWSIMAPGIAMDEADGHGGAVTLDFGTIIGGPTTFEEEAVIAECLATWEEVSGFSSLGKVADGGGPGGSSNAQGGHLGDLRFALVGGDYAFNALAHANVPGSQNSPGFGGIPTWNFGGDVHVNPAYEWVDDPNAGVDEYDFETVMLHEIGHALGLLHSSEPDSVMTVNYAGVRRSLHEDDIAGIQAIYGANPVPEPLSTAGLATGVVVWALRRRKGGPTLSCKSP